MAHGFWGFPSGSWEQGQFLAFCDPQKWFPLILSVVLGSLPPVRVLPYSAADRRGRPADLQSHLEAALSSPALRPVSSGHVASRMSSSISSAQGNPSAWPGVPSSTLQPRNSPQEEKWGSDRAHLVTSLPGITVVRCPGVSCLENLCFIWLVHFFSVRRESQSSPCYSTFPRVELWVIVFYGSGT